MAFNVLQLLNILDGNYSGEEQGNKLIALRCQCEQILTREFKKNVDDHRAYFCDFSKLQFAKSEIAVLKSLPSKVRHKISWIKYYVN